MSNKVTDEQIRAFIKEVDEAAIPQGDRMFWCPYCKETHSEKTLPPPDCQLVKELLDE